MPRPYNHPTVADAIESAFDLFSDLREEFEEFEEVEPELCQTLEALHELDPPHLAGLVEYLGEAELTVTDYRSKYPTHDLVRDTALEFLGAAQELLEERAKSFHEYSSGSSVSEKPADWNGPWTPAEYESAATELDSICAVLAKAIELGQNVVFPSDSGDEHAE